MPFLETIHVKLVGLAACVPKKVEENNTLAIFVGDEADKFIASTGIERRRLANDSLCTSDLCFEAAEQLIKDLAWEKSSIDCLIFVSQTADYILPATSCILQDRLGLSENCYTLDISLGCSGWIYGLSVISALLCNGNMKKGLLLVGDIASGSCSPNDKTTYPLFGDAGTATAIEFDKNSDGFKFHLATDGSGHKAIIIPDGGFRNKTNMDSFTMEKIEPGVERSRLNTVLEGMDVFSFGITKVPETVNKLLEHFSLDKEAVDHFVFHQANFFLNEKIRKKLKLPESKLPYSLKDFGNTSSATIPLTMITALHNELTKTKLHVIAVGFGVGLSWGSVYFETDSIICSDLIEI